MREGESKREKTIERDRDQKTYSNLPYTYFFPHIFVPIHTNHIFKS